MKFLKSSFIILLCVVSIFLCGCEKKSFSQPDFTRDNYNTGGNLTFYYDQQAHVAYFGGEGEVVQYYEEDVAKGWTEKGCRVGISLTLPTEIEDYKSASAKVNGKEYNSNDFIVEINDETVIAQFQPIVSEDNRIINIKISWQEDSEAQEYKIIIKEGTIFMQEE